jgi:hypothetical protein
MLKGDWPVLGLRTTSTSNRGQCHVAGVIETEVASHEVIDQLVKLAEKDQQQAG